jgi:hypothetical protein
MEAKIVAYEIFWEWEPILKSVSQLIFKKSLAQDGESTVIIRGLSVAL